jgi:hypothetical protein
MRSEERWRRELPSLYDPDQPLLPPGTQSWTFDLARIEPVVPPVPRAAAREVAVEADPIMKMLHRASKARPRR